MNHCVISLRVDKCWPSTMLPFTYHGHLSSTSDLKGGDEGRESNIKKNVRICDCCHLLMIQFVEALRAGDLVKAKALYATDNVNVHQPFSIFGCNDYAVHLACKSGSVDMMKWLLETLEVKLRYSDADFKRIANKKFYGESFEWDRNDRNEIPYRNGLGLTVFALAAKYAHQDLMRYLILKHNCKVTEIDDISILHRGMHVALGASMGTVPKYVKDHSGWFSSKSTERNDTSLIIDADRSNQNENLPFNPPIPPSTSNGPEVRAAFFIPGVRDHIHHEPATEVVLRNWVSLLMFAYMFKICCLQFC